MPCCPATSSFPAQQTQTAIASTFNYTLELLRASQDCPGALSSMLFTVSRALRITQGLPDGDYLFQQLTDILSSSVDHLNAYEDFTGLILVGSEQEVVDFEEWANGPRRNQSVELTMLDLLHRVRLADPAGQIRVVGDPDTRVTATPQLVRLLAEREHQIAVAEGVQQLQQGVAAGAFIDLTRGGDVVRGFWAPPTSPTYTPASPTIAAAGRVQVPIPIPVPMPMPVVGGGAVVTTSGPAAVAVNPAPVHRVDSVEHLFIPADVGMQGV